MAYKTILVHVDQSTHAAQRIRLAAALAIAENAHLIGTATTGVSRFIYYGGVVDPADPLLSIQLADLREGARAALAAFESQVRGLGVLSFETRLVEDDASAGVVLQARYSDLVVIGQTDPQDPVPGVLPDFPEYVVLNAGRPVLIVPFAGQFAQLGSRVLVAWNASFEATRAVTAALPLLQRAKEAHVVICNPAQASEPHGAQPGADIALYLARHGVAVDVCPQHTELDAGNALLSLAADLCCDLLVMGGYGHSRLREIMLGGATRTILASMTVPVLMSH